MSAPLSSSGSTPITGWEGSKSGNIYEQVENIDARLHTIFQVYCQGASPNLEHNKGYTEMKAALREEIDKLHAIAQEAASLMSGMDDTQLNSLIGRIQDVWSIQSDINQIVQQSKKVGAKKIGFSKDTARKNKIEDLTLEVAALETTLFHAAIHYWDPRHLGGMDVKSATELLLSALEVKSNVDEAIQSLHARAVQCKAYLSELNAHTSSQYLPVLSGVMDQIDKPVAYLLESLSKKAKPALSYQLITTKAMLDGISRDINLKKVVIEGGTVAANTKLFDGRSPQTPAAYQARIKKMESELKALGVSMAVAGHDAYDLFKDQLRFYQDFITTQPSFKGAIAQDELQEMMLSLSNIHKSLSTLNTRVQALSTVGKHSTVKGHLFGKNTKARKKKIREFLKT